MTIDLTILEERVRALEDERSILHTLHTYGHSLDYGYEEEFLDCWSETAVLRWYNHPPYSGRELLTSVFRWHTHAPEVYHKHLLIEPRIALAGDTATADSYYARLDNSPSGPVLRSFGRYRDVMVRCPDGRWRFQERRHEPESRIPEAWAPEEGMETIGVDIQPGQASGSS
jgi:hypothetical protein